MNLNNMCLSVLKNNGSGGVVYELKRKNTFKKPTRTNKKYSKILD